MKNFLLKSIFFAFIVLSFNGCIVGTIVSLPFKVVGAAVNTVTPDIVGDSIGVVGDVADIAIPF